MTGGASGRADPRDPIAALLRRAAPTLAGGGPVDRRAVLSAGARLAALGSLLMVLPGCLSLPGLGEPAPGIDRFTGRWQGTATSGAAGRPLRLLVEPIEDGFILTWNGFDSDVQAPAEIVEARETSITFLAAGRAGWNGMDLPRDERATAKIEDGALVVEVTRRAAGRVEERRYRWTPSMAGSLALDYVRTLDQMRDFALGGTLSRLGG